MVRAPPSAVTAPRAYLLTPRRARPAVGLAAKIHAEVAGVDDATAQKLAQMAHEFCPYSRATRGNIDVEISGAAAK